MTPAAYAQQVYAEMQVTSTDPRRLVVLLFEAACRFLLQAREALERRDFEQHGTSLARVQQIYAELEGALREEVGGELARSLRALYAHLRGLLLQASLDEDLELLDEALSITRKLCEAWKEAELRCRT